VAEREKKLEVETVARQAEVAERAALKEQLEDVRRQNEVLQKRIDEELAPKESGPKVIADEADMGSEAPGDVSDFSRMMDSWLTTLEDANAPPGSPQNMARRRKGISGSLIWASLFGES
jgi:hypothetical protein